MSELQKTIDDIARGLIAGPRENVKASPKR